MRPRLYLSGPMTGLPDLNFPAFRSAAHALRCAGFIVTNPADLNGPGVSWSECMRADIKALCDCDAVATLPGWQHSKGATLEVHIAERLQMEVRPLSAWLADTKAAA